MPHSARRHGTLEANRARGAEGVFRHGPSSTDPGPSVFVCVVVALAKFESHLNDTQAMGPPAIRVDAVHWRTLGENLFGVPLTPFTRFLVDRHPSHNSNQNTRGKHTHTRTKKREDVGMPYWEWMDACMPGQTRQAKLGARLAPADGYALAAGGAGVLLFFGLRLLSSSFPDVQVWAAC